MIPKRLTGMGFILLILFLASITTQVQASDVIWEADFEDSDLSDWDLEAYYTDSNLRWQSMDHDFVLQDGMLVAPESDEDNITHFAFHNSATESGRWTFTWVPDADDDSNDIIAFIMQDTVTNYNFDGVNPEDLRFDGYALQLEVFNSEGRIPDTRIQLLRYLGSEADILNSIVVTRVLGNLIQGEHVFEIERSIAGIITLTMDNTFLFSVEEFDYKPASVKLFWNSIAGSTAIDNIVVEENIFVSTITESDFIWLSLVPGFMLMVIIFNRRK